MQLEHRGLNLSAVAALAGWDNTMLMLCLRGQLHVPESLHERLLPTSKLQHKPDNEHLVTAMQDAARVCVQDAVALSHAGLEDCITDFLQEQAEWGKLMGASVSLKKLERYQGCTESTAAIWQHLLQRWRCDICHLHCTALCLPSASMRLSLGAQACTSLIIHHFKSLFWGLANPSDFEQTVLLRCQLYKQASMQRKLSRQCRYVHLSH